MFSTALIYLSQMHFSASFYVSVQALCPHMGESVRVCARVPSLSLWPLSCKAPYHTQHTMRVKTADRLPVAFLLYAGMIETQPDVTVKEAPRNMISCLTDGR